MSDISRRKLLQVSTASALIPSTAILSAPPLLAADTRQAAASPHRCFQPAEFAALDVLCSAIIPADEHSGGAHQAGAAEYIDLLAGNNPNLALLFRGGLAWLNAMSFRLYNRAFSIINNAERTALLEKIAYGENVDNEYRPGAIFFDWARRMTVDAYYTSKAGIVDLGYIGNTASAEFIVPAEVLEQARERFKFLRS